MKLKVLLIIQYFITDALMCAVSSILLLWCALCTALFLRMVCLHLIGAINKRHMASCSCEIPAAPRLTSWPCIYLYKRCSSEFHPRMLFQSGSSARHARRMKWGMGSAWGSSLPAADNTSYPAHTSKLYKKGNTQGAGAGCNINQNNEWQ